MQGIGLKGLAASVAFTGLLFFPFVQRPQSEPKPRSLRQVPVAGNPDLLIQRYEAWKENREAIGPVFDVILAPSKYLPRRSLEARLVARIRLDAGTLELVSGRDLDYDVWIRGRDRNSGAGPTTRSFGPLEPAGEGAFRLPDADELEIQSISLSEPGLAPEEGGFLKGRPSVFQRFLSAEFAEAQQSRQPAVRLASAFALPEVDGSAEQGMSGLEADAEQMVLAGELIFTEETFRGNGRTCATCHRPDNNYTIDPEYIATLPSDDRLFVAETMDDLNSDLNGGDRFEVPHLLRSKGLVLVNIDGFDELSTKYVLRAVPHLLGLGVDTETVNEATNVPHEHLLGWSGDGSPLEDPFTGGTTELSGKLEEFAIGAIYQHFPKTMDRLAGPVPCDTEGADSDEDEYDFCFPSEDQLMKLECFLRSIGRQPDGTNVADPLIHRNGIAQAGSEFFVRSLYGCGRCHENGGGYGQEQLADLGTEDWLHCSLQYERDPLQTYDAGFGTEPIPSDLDPVRNCDSADPVDLQRLRQGSWGDLRFNSVSVIESADTAPYFHNNAAATLGDAIRFYNTNEFFHSNSSVHETSVGNCVGAGPGQGCAIIDTEVTQIETFLRIANALDNLESQVAPFLARAKVIFADPAADPGAFFEVLDLAQANLQDVLQVLTEGEVWETSTTEPVAIAEVTYAMGKVNEALSPLNRQADPVSPIVHIDDALDHLCQAWADMAVPCCPWGESC